MALKVTPVRLGNPWAGVFLQNLDNEHYFGSRRQKGLRGKALSLETNRNLRINWTDAQLETGGRSGFRK